MPQIETNTIKGLFPRDFLGEVVSAFDRFDLGFSLRQPFTVNSSRETPGHDELNVTIADDERVKAESLVAFFNTQAWMSDAKLEHAVIEMPEPSAETKARVEAMLRDMRQRYSF